MAGVLFGAGQGTTLGSFAPRVRSFLASVAPDIDQINDRGVANVDGPRPPMLDCPPAIAPEAIDNSAIA